MQKNMFNYRSKEDMKKEYNEVKKWLDGILDRPVEEIGEFFKKRSEGYDKMRLEKFNDEYREIIEFLPDTFETLLDIGCGSGFEFNYIFQKHPNIKVTGIDICREMLDIFERNFKNKNIELIEADYFLYPFEKTQYDVVLSVQSLHHFEFEKKKKIYSKIFEATKIGGAYYEFDYMAQDEDYEKLNLKYYHEIRKTNSIEKDTIVHIDIPMTVDHQIELLKAAGFKKVAILNKPFLKGNTVYLKAVK